MNPVAKPLDTNEKTVLRRTQFTKFLITRCCQKTRMWKIKRRRAIINSYETKLRARKVNKSRSVRFKLISTSFSKILTRNYFNRSTTWRIFSKNKIGLLQPNDNLTGVGKYNARKSVIAVNKGA